MRAASDASTYRMSPIDLVLTCYLRLRLFKGSRGSFVGNPFENRNRVQVAEASRAVEEDRSAVSSQGRQSIPEGRSCLVAQTSPRLGSPSR